MKSFLLIGFTAVTISSFIDTSQVMQVSWMHSIGMNDASPNVLKRSLYQISTSTISRYIDVPETILHSPYWLQDVHFQLKVLTKEVFQQSASYITSTCF